MVKFDTILLDPLNLLPLTRLVLVNQVLVDHDDQDIAIFSMSLVTPKPHVHRESLEMVLFFLF